LAIETVGRRSELGGRAEQQYAYSVGGGQAGAGGYLGRAEVGPVGVNRDARRAGGARHGAYP
jgi:hypothetical protein